MNPEEQVTESASTAALAVAAMEPHRCDIDSEPFVIVPEGYRVDNVEHTLIAPVRKSGTTKVRDAESFIAVVNDQKGSGTRLYRTVEPPRFVAVFNDHESATKEYCAGWGDHRAVYDCPLSPEWRTWIGKNLSPMKQSDFAQFIENNLPDITVPDSGAMLEIVKRLTAKKKVAFTSGLRLDNGEIQFTYEEQIEGSAGPRGQFAIPQEFTIAVQIFEGDAKYKFTARFRYRIGDGGDLMMWYDLLRPHKMIEDAVGILRQEIEGGTAMKSINGFRED